MLLAALLTISPILFVIDPTLGDSAVPWWCGGGGLLALYIILKGDAGWRARMLYAVTDVRALSCSIDGRGAADSLPIPNKVRIEPERNDRGTIYIGTASRPVMQIGFWVLYEHKQIVFEAVEDSRRAYALIRRGEPLQLNTL